MKKIVSLMGILALGTSFVFAANVNLEQLFKDHYDFGYTTNDNISLVGLQDDPRSSGHKNLVLKTPLLTSDNDQLISDYYAYVGKAQFNKLLSGENVEQLRNELIPFYIPGMSLDGEREADLEIPMKDFDPQANYFGFVVPLDNNGYAGSHSQEFCFNLEKDELKLGEDCKVYGEEKTAEVVAATDEHAAAGEEHEAAGADMGLANISHTVKGNQITLTWMALKESELLDIKLFNKETADFDPIATVRMDAEKYVYTYDDKTQEFLFAFIPKNNKGKEKRYDMNVRQEVEAPAVIKKVPTVGPAEDMLMIALVSLLAFGGYSLYRKKRAE